MCAIRHREVSDIERELLHENGEFLDDKPEAHNSDACPYPREKSPFVRHVNTAIAYPFGLFLVGYFSHRAQRLHEYFKYS
jgi:hypothetical protein